MRLLRPLAFALAAALGVALPASASTTSVDFTDLWYIPAESGWGLNLIQQSNVIFATLFVYGSDNTPRWYVASDLESSGGTTFSGTLYKTTGPYFGAPWTGGNPAVVAGNMTLVFNSETAATLTYTADGVTVTKSIQRQTWRSENLTGKYLGGISANASSCNGVQNGPVIIFGTSAIVAHNPSSQSFSMQLSATSANGQATLCTFTGTYAQAGKLGSVGGNWSCTSNGAAVNNGTFSISQIDASIRGFNGAFQGQDQFCQYSGNFGVVRDVQQ